MVENLNIKWEEIPDFEGDATGDFAGDKISIDGILNTPLAILKFRISPSSFYEDANYMMVQILTRDNQLKWFVTSSAVLCKQMQEQQKNLPLKVKIIKIKRYYSIKPVSDEK
jgi:hypothetical protein